jgi:DNA modification methylase
MTPRKEILAEGVECWLGDCREVLPTLPAVDLLVTDPPYGIDFATNRGFSSWDGEKIAGDACTTVREEVLRLAKFNGAIVFGSWRVAKPERTRAVLIWDKGEGVGMGDLSLPWKPNHEEIYIIGNGFSGHRGSGVLRHVMVSWESKGREHPTQKPLSLMLDLLEKADGAAVLDPFMGSGTTGVACVQRGLSFVGVEREPKYFDIACRRISEALKAPSLFVPAPALPKQEAFNV